MRINKELQSLSRHFEITYVGVGQSNKECFARNSCKYFYLIIGKRNVFITICKHIWLVFKLKPRKFHSIHIINEQLMVFFYPLLFRNHLVLDVFDSIFLIWNKSKNKWKLLKRVVYAPVDVVLVTDNNRKELMPTFVQEKIKILENYPLRFHPQSTKNVKREGLTILYSGWLGKFRGTDVLIKLLEADPTIRVIMAGWFADELSVQLSKHHQVDYRGIMTQEESLTIAHDEADYILSVYAPENENNINASPNKIYDAIQVSTPVIINKEILIAQFVESHNLGIVIENYYHFDANTIIENLKKQRSSFHFSEELKSTYTWENIEHVLLEAHKA